jgi:hypothetical protein
VLARSGTTSFYPQGHVVCGLPFQTKGTAIGNARFGNLDIVARGQKCTNVLPLPGAARRSELVGNAALLGQTIDELARISASGPDEARLNVEATRNLNLLQAVQREQIQAQLGSGGLVSQARTALRMQCVAGVSLPFPAHIYHSHLVKRQCHRGNRCFGLLAALGSTLLTLDAALRHLCSTSRSGLSCRSSASCSTR